MYSRILKTVNAYYITNREYLEPEEIEELEEQLTWLSDMCVANGELYDEDSDVPKLDIHIIRATAIYTGGNQYEYFAELDNGNWIMGGDEWLVIVNTNPISDDLKQEYGFESEYEDWQQAHLVKYIDDNDYQKYLNPILDEIFKGNTIKGLENYSIDELKCRYKLGKML